jgi:NAD(P)-dependent dehydrogenase (short-subunit alcohol dehydrogenase family)
VTLAGIDTSALFRLDGKVAVVTGASSGIGHRIGRLLDGAGATVVLAARRKDRLDDLAASLDRAEAVACDVSDEHQCQDLIDGTVRRHGRIDILVNNAGTGHRGHAEEFDLAEFRRTFEVNVHGAFALSQAAAIHMLPRGCGTVLNIASIAGMRSLTESPTPAYNASKAALLMLTRELAAQWAGSGVRVNAIAPGFFHTEINARSLDEPAFGDWARHRTPMGRIGEGAELDGPRPAAHQRRVQLHDRRCRRRRRRMDPDLTRPRTDGTSVVGQQLFTAVQDGVEGVLQ